MAFPKDKKTMLTIPGPQGALEAIASSPKEQKSNDIAIICHPHPLYQGTMHNKVITTLARAFDDLGLRTVRFNYRGVEKSEGKYGEGIGETEDALAVIEWARSQSPDSDIWIAGFSFGGFVAANAANQYPAKQLITIAPSVEHFDFSPLQSIHCPWLVIQGEADEVVSPEAVYRFCEARADIDLVRFPEVGHFFHGQLVPLRELLIEKLKASVGE